MNLNKVGELTTSDAGLESMKTHYRRDLEKVLHLIDGSALNLDVEEKPSVIQKIEIIDDILYGVGYIGTAHGAFHIAAYWESDHCTLLSNGKERAIANAMCKIGSDIYVVGQEGNNAVYWKNGKKIALTKSKINPNFASDIASYDNDVYIAGHIFENNIYSAGYWKDGKFTTAIRSEERRVGKEC